jgi:glutamate-ammonia-ligase adenylyltransferase
VRAADPGRERDDLSTLRQEVSEMRAKMRENLGSKGTAAGTGANAFEATAPFDLKQDAGGIVDIEFMVQYAALAWSKTHPPLLRWTDNIRILEELEHEGLMPVADASLLREAYTRLIAQPLTDRPCRRIPGWSPGDQFADERREVMRIWGQLGLS